MKTISRTSKMYVSCLLTLVFFGNCNSVVLAQDMVSSVDDTTSIVKNYQVISIEKAELSEHVIYLSTPDGDKEIEIRILSCNDNGNDEYNFDIYAENKRILIEYNTESNTINVEESSFFRNSGDYIIEESDPELEVEEWMLAPVNHVTKNKMQDELPIKLEDWMLNSEEWASAE